MIIGFHVGTLNRHPRRAGAVICTALLALCGGCPNGGEQPPPDNGNDNEPDGPTAAEIVSPSSGFEMSTLDQPVSVRYNVDESAINVSGFRVPVEDDSPGSDPIGDRETIATNLTTGTNQFFNFDPGEAGVGFFRVGIEFSLNGVEDDAESEAVIQVLGSPAPEFILPLPNFTQVTQGTDVPISFDCNGPEAIVEWRLFYMSDADSRDDPADELGTALLTGTGNVGTSRLRTASLAAGNYQIGVSATDTGESVADTVDSGESDRIVTVYTHVFKVVEPGQAKPPTIVVTTPATDASVYKDDPFTILFSGKVNEPGATGTIGVFYDSNEIVGDGFTSIAANLPVSASSVLFPTGVPAGTYFIGATISDGINQPVTDYAAGKLTVVRIVTLDVTAPASSLSVAPGAKVDVKWTTNAPAGSGTVDVFYQTVNSAGDPFGPEHSILNDDVITTKAAQFSSPIPGLFEITVRLNLKDGTKMQEAAPQQVRVTSLPTVLWLGSLADADSGVQGAIFGGVNFEDNSGTSLAAAGDLNGDTFDEFVIGSRYGKPFFVNPTGIGPGEAYIIYGGTGTNRLQGTYHLNAVGTSVLRGVVLRGVRTVSDSIATDGLADITLIPDADGDGKGELVFGFPDTDSARYDALDQEGQFRYGGIVILSSKNSALTEPVIGNSVIGLDSVGREFSNETVTPPTSAAACLADRQMFQEATVGPPPTEAACVAGTDTVVDTIIGATAGFMDWLTPSCAERVGFTPITPDSNPPPPAEFVCETLVAGECIASGFFGTASAPPTPLEPRGARVLGRNVGNRFGTSVTVSRPFGDDSLVNLIISAPNRSARTDEIDGLLVPPPPPDVRIVPNTGVAYITLNRPLWGMENSSGVPIPPIPPTPNQYSAGFASHCGDNRAPFLDATGICGDENDKIQNILGIDDFNGDGRDDIAVGAPLAPGVSGGPALQGRLYIAYRRDSGGLEGDFVLNKLKLAPDDPRRLDGILIRATSQDSLGTSLAGGFDFNGDGFPDLAVSSPTAAGGAGEVLIIFGRTGIISPVDGIPVETLLSTMRTASGGPVAARIRGNPLDATGQFGFNIVNAGDIDGDDLDDLLVAAPNATPRFDPNPNDAMDEMTAPGVDLDFDGVQDVVPGDKNLPEAGLVYIIYGSNRLDQFKTCKDTDKVCTTSAECPAGKPCGSTNFTININQLGKPQLRGLIIAGRRERDRIGGGDAGDSGIQRKIDAEGRSRGLAGAGDVDGDNRADILIGSLLADPRRDPVSDVGVKNGGESYLIYGASIP